MMKMEVEQRLRGDQDLKGLFNQMAEDSLMTSGQLSHDLREVEAIQVSQHKELS